MDAVTLKHWLVCDLVPITILVVMGLASYSVVRRGWFRVLPVLSQYVLISCLVGLSGMALLLFELKSANFQSLNVFYSGLYYVSAVINSFFLIAVCAELTLDLGAAQSFTGRKKFAKVVLRTAIFIFILAVPLMFSQRKEPNFGVVGKAISIISQSGILLVVIAVPLIFVIKRFPLLREKKMLVLLLAALGICSLLEIAFSYLIFRGHGSSTLNVSGQLNQLVFALIVYAAVADQPRISESARAAALNRD
jgi:hypothetical protein